jgi:hypothetical protein
VSRRSRHSAWRVAFARGERTDFLLVESEGEILYVAKVLGVERVTAREIAAMPKLEGRIRFITSHHVPDFVEALIGTAVPEELLNRNPVRYAVSLMTWPPEPCASSQLAEGAELAGTQDRGHHVKEDVLEQIVDDYLQAQGYFTRHNIKFRPDPMGLTTCRGITPCTQTSTSLGSIPS